MRRYAIDCSANASCESASGRQTAGVRLGLEPLNRYETSVINTVAQGLEALEPLLGAGLGLALDTYHLNIIASGPAIATELRRAGVDATGSADVVALVRAGNTAAIDATRQAGREVGEVLATVVNMLNPSVIVIGGSVARAGEHLLAGIREVVYRRSIPLATKHLGIVQSEGGDRAGVLGAVIMVSQLVLAPAHVDALASTP